ncbi:MAG TPA: ectonucleotide pyrophosphatase/phosphodiesterase [Tepidisphaeraceae bacterium]|nr:ectonucleotide pyrophosphatase/phosphodiesterase [Tepidisphaeraceae bacterium]
MSAEPRSNRRLIFRLLAAVFAGAMVVRLFSAAPQAGAVASKGEDDELLRTVAPPRSPYVKRALIVSIDGLRPDLLLRARTPNLRGLMGRGSYSMWARTTEMSITLPSHTSMLSGVTPENHRIVWNHYIANIFPDVPTIFELAHKAGYTTALVSGKTKFHELCRPGSVQFVDVFWETASRKVGPDLDTADAACGILRRHNPDLMFVHLGQTDETGHAIGWGTPQQIAAIERADAAVGMVLSTYREMGVLDEMLVIVSADHGGQGKGHGPNDPRSRHIPWIAAGPGIKRDFDLTRHADLVVNTEDTFATACHLLRISVPHKVDGRFVKQILEAADPADKPKTAKKKTDPPDAPKDDEYTPWEAPPYKPEWERVEIRHH